MRGSPVGFDCARMGDKEFGNFFQEYLHFCCVAVAQIVSQNQVISALFKGALCDIEKPYFVTDTALPETFCDVRRNRYRRPTHLARQTVDLTSGKPGCESIGC